jgi:NADP-dependent 3-hydroxy acid dehydrogenase YdfG
MHMRKHNHRPDRMSAAVAGAATGVGAATARSLAAAGFLVALGAPDAEGCRKVADQIRRSGGEAVVYPLDFTDPDSVRLFAKSATDALGNIQVVVSAAGTVAPGMVHEASRELGARRLVQAFLPAMLERGRGDFVFVSSDVAVRSRPFMSAYSVGSWGVEGMAQAMQKELEGTGVRASIVRPGPAWNETGLAWEAEHGAPTINQWVRFGHTRNTRSVAPAVVASVVTMLVSAPREVHLSLVEVLPEASSPGKA